MTKPIKFFDGTARHLRGYRMAKRDVCLFFLFWLTPALFVNPLGYTMADSSLATAIRLVNQHRLDISPHEAIDVAAVGGQIYSGLPPGLWVLSAPLYYALRPIINRLPDDTTKYTIKSALQPPFEPARGAFYLQILLVWLLMAPLAALFQLRMSRWLAKSGAGPSTILGLPLIAGVGTIVLCYSCAYSKQCLSELLIWNVLFWSLNREACAPFGASAMAGWVLGLGVGVDYTAIIPVTLIIGFLILYPEKVDAPSFLAGFFGAVALLLYYHHFFFHNMTPYHFRIWPHGQIFYKGRQFTLDQFQKGPFLGILHPTWASLYGLTVSPFKGLFLFCPVLLLGLWGSVQGRRRATPLLVLGWLMLFASLLFDASLQGELYWSGGPQYFGPRYLIAPIPIVLLGLRYLRPTIPWKLLIGAVAAISVGINMLGAMFQDKMLEASLMAPLLQNPIAALAGLFLHDGPRIPILAAYGAAPSVQHAVFVYYAGILMAGFTLLWRSNRQPA